MHLQNILKKMNTLSEIVFVGLLTLIFIGLKLTYISWSWWWVLSPLWILIICWIVLLMIIMIIRLFTKKGLWRFGHKNG